MDNGTPKTLDELIKRLPGHTADDLYYMLRDFMAQKFAIAYLQSASDDETKALERLFKLIIKRDDK